ncbi:hypothetical protein GCM10009554_36430 [Kribbella koreensis]|uniref:Bulb-type lectin domain-containing protein n=2 Tax=Kribbella TaxID=182639 RepID=A0ABP6XWQ3_9ACTN
MKAFTAVLAATLATAAALVTTPAQAAPTTTTSTTAIADQLLPGQRLTAGQYIRSKDHQWILVMRATGKLELLRPGTGTYEWAINTERKGSVLRMETDGSLSIIYGRTKVWSGGAKASPKAKLVLPNDGLLKIVTPLGKSVWNRHMIIETMWPGSELWAAGPRNIAVSVFSPSKVYTLQLRPNGDLELMKNNKTLLWRAPDPSKTPDSIARLTPDGTFAVYNNFNLPTWSVGGKKPGTVVQVRDDGSLVLIWGRTLVKKLH